MAQEEKAQVSLSQETQVDFMIDLLLNLNNFLLSVDLLIDFFTDLNVFELNWISLALFKPGINMHRGWSDH